MSPWTSANSLRQSAAYQELSQALAEPGCPLCAIAQHQVRTHIGGILWDSVTDPSSRARLDASLGLCARHSRIMLTFAGERLAVTIVQQAVLKEATRRLTKSPPAPRTKLLDKIRRTIRHRLQSWTQPGESQSAAATPALTRNAAPATSADLPASPAPCPGCDIEARTETRVADVLVRHLRDDLAAPLQQAGGLCRPHLYMCLARSTPEQHAALITLHEALWTELGAHLGEFIRKRDHRFQHEPITDTERNAVERSVYILTGNDPLYK